MHCWASFVIPVGIGAVGLGFLTISVLVDLVLLDNTSTLTSIGQREFAKKQLQWADSGHEYDTDFVIRSMDGKDFFTNPFLLSAHLPVFAAMLCHDTKKKRVMCCEMTDVDGETVAILLDYLYGTETNKINGQTAEKVLLTADKYQLIHLRSFTQQVLARTVTMENAVYGLRFANLHKLAGLKEACLKVIRKNMGTVLSNKELVKSDPEMMQVILALVPRRPALPKFWE